MTLGVVAVALGPWAALGVALAGSAGLAGALTVAFSRGVWLSLSEPLVAVALATLSGVTYQYMVEGREKRRVKQMFGRYVSRDVFDQLMADPALARLGGQRRDMSVLFSDIRGFTTVSEAGEPEAIVGPAERVLLADGADRLRRARDRRQVRRRHDHGALRRAAGRRRSRRPRGGRRPWRWSPSCGG